MRPRTSTISNKTASNGLQKHQIQQRDERGTSNISSQVQVLKTQLTKFLIKSDFREKMFLEINNTIWKTQQSLY